MINYFKKHVFGRLAFLFGVAALVLVVLTYYVMNWAVRDKDTILDIHDLYYHYKFIESWNDMSDTALIREELENLQLSAKIYFITSTNLCEEDNFVDYVTEQSFVYWQNTAEQTSICNYLNYQDSENLKQLYGVSFPAHVSFGDIEINNTIYPATVIEKDSWRVLLIIDYIYPKEWVTFFPIVLLSFLFMVVLYFILMRFLKPISLMRQRILALEQGDLDSSIPIIGEDELALLSRNFNTLIAEIKKLLKQKERLLSDVSHEIRTPLSKMRLLLAMKPTENKIKKMDAQIEYLDSIVTNILISDKLSVPYSQLDIEQIDVINLLKQAIDLSKHNNVNLQIDSSFAVWCDVVKMSIVIKNVLDNAEKYAPSQDGVIVTASLINGLVSIACVDYGPGIPEDLINKISKPFVRGQNLKKSGFGLGLSICHKILAAHDGKLEVCNNKNQGACFTIQWKNCER